MDKLRLVKKDSEGEADKFNKYLEDVANMERTKRRQQIEEDRKNNRYVIHEMVENFKGESKLSFLLEEMEYYKTTHLLDAQHRTWLHCASSLQPKLVILKYLVETLMIDTDAEDDYGYTPLHYACQNSRISRDTLQMLIKNEASLLKQAKDGETPIDFLYENKGSLNVLIDIQKLSFKDLLDKMEASTKTMATEPQQMVSGYSRDIWSLSKIIAKNDKTKLMRWIDNDPTFVKKYHLSPKIFITIARRYFDKESAKGSVIDALYEKDHEETEILALLVKKMFKIDIRILPRDKVFFNSILFFAIITQSYKLIPILLQFCQFNIVSYAVMCCWTCQQMSEDQMLGAQWQSSISDVRQFCENFAVRVLVATDLLVTGNDVFLYYLTARIRETGNKTILDIAYENKCVKFMSTSICQNIISILWTKSKCFIDLFDSNAPEKKGCVRGCSECCLSVNVTYSIHLLFHLTFLVIFSYIMTNKHVSLKSPEFIFVMVYTLGYLSQEGIQMHYYHQRDNILYYFKDRTNSFDICAILFNVLGVVLISVSGELTLINNTNFSFAARCSMSISLICFYIRLLHFALKFEVLGPKIKMIGKMFITDLLPLLFVFGVFVTCFGIILQSILIDTSFSSKSIDIFRRSTFSVFTIEGILGEIESAFSNSEIKLFIALIVLLAFVITTNVMLMNLLIALFSNTVTEISQGSKEYVNVKRFSMLKDLKYRTFLPPPLNMLELIFQFFTKPLRRRQEIKRLKEEPSETEINPLRDFLVKRSDIYLTGRRNYDKYALYYLYQTFAMKDIRQELRKET